MKRTLIAALSGGMLALAASALSAQAAPVVAPQGVKIDQTQVEKVNHRRWHRHHQHHRHWRHRHRHYDQGYRWRPHYYYGLRQWRHAHPYSYHRHWRHYY